MHWGGHPVAVGLSIKEANVEEFTKRFLRAVKNQLGDEPQNSILEIDAFIRQKELTEKSSPRNRKACSFRTGKPEPILAIKEVRLFGKTRKVGSGHFQFSIHNGIEPVSGIAWRMAEDVPGEAEIDIAIRLQWNTWNQKKRLQMVLVSWKTH